MQGTRVDLPGQLGKDEESHRRFSAVVEVALDGSADFRIEQAGQAHAWLQMTPEGKVSGTVSLGSAAPVSQANDGLKVTGRLADADAMEWLAWAGRQGGQGGQDGQDGLWPEMSDVQIDRLHWAGISVKDARVSAQFLKQGQRVSIDAPAARGTIDIPTEKGALVRADFDWLQMPGEERGSAPTGGGTELDPETLPPLDLTIREMEFDAYPLQAIRLVTEPGEGQMIIKRLDVASHQFTSNLTGRWILKEGKHETVLRGAMRSEDLSETLNHWSIDNPLSQGVMETELSLRWPGMPQEYSFSEAQGNIDIKGRDGRIRNVAPELARVLALLNLEMIFDRLSLDFDDVTRGGFTYQTAEGQFDFRKGSLYTDGFRIVGPSAQFLIIGRTGVEEEDYDLKVITTPETSALLPVAGAAGGPLGVAGIYIGNKILEFIGISIDDATAVTYKVTGTWSEPAIEEQISEIKASGPP